MLRNDRSLRRRIARKRGACLIRRAWRKSSVSTSSVKLRPTHNRELALDAAPAGRGFPDVPSRCSWVAHPPRAGRDSAVRRVVAGGRRLIPTIVLGPASLKSNEGERQRGFRLL